MDANTAMPNADVVVNSICRVSWKKGQRGSSEVAIWEDQDENISLKFYRMGNSSDVYRCSKCSSKRVRIIEDVLYTMSDRRPLHKEDLIKDTGEHRLTRCNTYIKG